MSHFLNIFILTIILSRIAIAAPVINIETNYYNISGSTANELRNDMNSKRIIAHKNGPFDADTSWNISWRLNWNIKNGKCHITAVSSNLDVVFSLPKWIDRDKADVKTIKKWDRYYNVLVQHENGHKAFGVKAAKNIEKTLLGIASSNTCPKLEHKANQLGKTILNKYILMEKEYDKTTNHGMNDGAVFP